VIISAHPIRREGELVGALLVIRDVSEVKFLQRRLADTANHLAIGQMAADIAHDFSNVLSTISQATSVLEAVENAPAQERRSYLGMIQNSVRRGMEIIQRMSEYIRGGKGERAQLDVTQVLGEALDLARPLIARRKNISVRTELKPACVIGNGADLRRSFANLVLNAVEAMPEGGMLTVKCCTNHERVRIAVRDTGTGIAPGDQKKIFSPYFTTKPEGTGLGLVGARHIFEEHGGKIRFHSEPGKGTEFVIELPAGEKAEAAA
jgi:signal transduction histidine kinase